MKNMLKTGKPGHYRNIEKIYDSSYIPSYSS